MTSPANSAVQVAYETLIDALKKRDADSDATFAPPWDEVPEHVRAAIDVALFAAAGVDEPDEPRDSEASFAVLAYRAYVKFTGGLNYQGKPCPKWQDLPEKIRGAWGAATLAARTEHESRHNIDFDWLEGSTEELVELVAALDALQEVGRHRQHVLVPLRTRLRAILNPPAEDSEDGNAAESGSPATESGSAESADPETSAGSTPLVDAPEGATGAELVTATIPEPTVERTNKFLCSRIGVRTSGSPLTATAAAVELPKLSDAPAAPELKVDLPPLPAPNDAPKPIGAEPEAAQLEVQAEPGSADAPAVGVAPEGHVQTSEQAEHTQTPDTK